jgi:isoquinoline 1-oxidoreductase beta subunit
MNHMPKLDRRTFLVGSTAAGLSLGFHIPFSGEAEAEATGPEVNAWVVCIPTRPSRPASRVPRWARALLRAVPPMVAEELECDWSKVGYEFLTAGQNVACKRVWADFFTAGSCGIRASDRSCAGGAAARKMLIAAAANEWKVLAAECTAANGIITHTASGAKRHSANANAASKTELPADIKLKDPKDWKIIGKGVKRLDTVDKVQGKTVYGIDVKLPGMLSAAIKAAWRQPKSLTPRRLRPCRREEGQKVDDNAVAVIADTWWNAKTAPGRCRWHGTEPERQGLQCLDRRVPQGRP